MKNLLYILLTAIVILSLSKGRQCVAQNYADKNYYLVDSLDLNQLPTSDLQLIDSCLQIYHASNEDTTKSHALAFICENMTHQDWSKYQLFQHEFIKRALSKNTSKKIVKTLKELSADDLNNMGYYYADIGKQKKAIEYYKEGIAISKQLKDKKRVAMILNNMGLAYGGMGDVENELKYYKKSLAIKKEINDMSGIARSLSNIGLVYKRQGNVVKAIEYYHASLKIREKIGDKHGIGTVLNNIGTIYLYQKDIEQSLDYLFKSLKVRKEVNDKRDIAESLNNIGYVYHFYGDPACKLSKEECLKEGKKKALDYYFESLKIRKEINHKYGIAMSLNNIGSIYDMIGDPDCEYDDDRCEELSNAKAMNYHKQSLALREELNDKHGIAISYDNIGGIYLKQGDTKKAKEIIHKALKLFQEMGFPNNIQNSSRLLYEIYEKENNGKNALVYYKLYVQMRDSINNKATQKAAAKQQAKYEYEKQKTIDDAVHDKQLAVEQEAKEKQQILTYATAGGLGLVVVFLIFVYNRLQVTKKQKLVIETQKQEVEHQKGIVELAHGKLEEKNKEILDSITYAKRIQNAILPPLKIVKESLEESFIYYKPKDIVAGDFYWMETISSTSLRGTKQSAQNDEIASSRSGVICNDELILFAAADCTGHGVPGAMVSVICNNGLNRSVREHKLTDPGEILDKTREIVIAEFEKSEEEVKDGMDIALCSLSVNSNQSTVLQYAGAHNPLWIISPVTSSADEGSVSRSKALENHLSLTTDNCLLYEIKANKQPIGKIDNPQPYTTHTIELQKGDTIYIFSDGYADQFGGEKGKKLKSANFKKLLLSIQNETMEKQRQLINEAFENWKGDLEQLDDVCVIGVRI